MGSGGGEGGVWQPRARPLLPAAARARVRLSRSTHKYPCRHAPPPRARPCFFTNALLNSLRRQDKVFGLHTTYVMTSSP